MKWDEKLKKVEEAVEQYNSEHGSDVIDIFSDATNGRVTVKLFAKYSVALDDIYDRIAVIDIDEDEYMWGFTLVDDAEELDFGHPDDFDAKQMLGDLLADIRAEYEDVVALIEDTSPVRHLEMYNRYASKKFALYDLLKKYGGLDE